MLCLGYAGRKGLCEFFPNKVIGVTPCHVISAIAMRGREVPRSAGSVRGTHGTLGTPRLSSLRIKYDLTRSKTSHMVLLMDFAPPCTEKTQAVAQAFAPTTSRPYEVAGPDSSGYTAFSRLCLLVVLRLPSAFSTMSSYWTAAVSKVFPSTLDPCRF